MFTIIHLERKSMMDYKGKDIREMTDEEFLQMIDEMCEESVRKAKLLSENAPKKFNSVEEVRAYYNSTPLEEWEKSIFEKYGIR